MANNLKHNAAAGKKPVNKKRIIIICCSVLAVCIAVAVVLFVFVFNNPANLPSDNRIKSDMEADKSITNVAVGKKTFDFTIKDFEKTGDKATPDKDHPEKYTAQVTITRESDVYGIKPAEYKVTYTKKGSKLEYKSSQLESKDLTFTALAGADKDDALKRVKKTFKKAKYKENKDDLKKGDSKVIFTVNDKEYSGTATAVYKFDRKKGWLFKKIDDKNVKFKKGVTHKENGLYTNSNVKNVLFLGVDSDDGAGRSDCMMLISIDKNTGTIKQTSFMRDNWFEIPGQGENKLNSAYAFGGADLTKKTIQNTFGIKIDKYVVVDFSTFKDVINTLGGIDVDITSDEAGYVNWQINKNGQAGSVGTISTAGGVTHLNGQQALWLCRDRGGGGFSGDDFMRTGRQRKVIQALVDTYKTYTPVKVLATLNVLNDKVKTDLTASDFAWYADRSPKFFKFKFKERCVPQEGEWQSGTGTGGAWIIQLNDFDKLKSDIQHFIYEDLK